MRNFEDKVGVFSRVGAFWYEGTDATTKALARHLAHAPGITGADRVIEQAQRGLLDGGRVFRTNIDLPWRPDQVSTLGADLQARVLSVWGGSDAGVSYFVIRRPDVEMLPGQGAVSLTLPGGDNPDFTLTVNGCSYLLFPVAGGTPDAIDPSDLELKWLVPIPPEVSPAVIAVGNRYLIAGVDFQLQRGALVFREDPFIIFQDREFLHCLSAWTDGHYLFNYPLLVDHTRPSSQAVVTFLRQGQSTHALRDALADVAGRVVLSTAVTISTARQWCDCWIYLLSDGRELEIDYVHEPYGPGDYLPAGALFGGGIRVDGGGGPGRGAWYRIFNWSQGLPMDDISPFAGLTIPDQPVKFEAYAVHGDNFHVRAWLPGNEEVRARYWQWTRQCELTTGRHLNEVFSFTAVDEVAYRNGIDFFFEHCLGEKALVVELDRALLGGAAYQRCVDFVQREKLHNTVLIILSP